MPIAAFVTVDLGPRAMLFWHVVAVSILAIVLRASIGPAARFGIDNAADGVRSAGPQRSMETWGAVWSDGVTSVWQ